MRHNGLGYFPAKDERDYPLKARIDQLESPKTRGSKWWQNLLRLNQGAWDACVGFAHVQALNSSPTPHNYDDAYAIEVYKKATYIDEWPRDNWSTDGGTSVRAGAKEMQRRGHIPAYAFTRDVEQVALWILNKNPVIIGINWYWSMDECNPENDYYLHVQGQRAGGHATVLDGARWNGDSRDYFRGLNSWGGWWGDDGRFKLKVQSLEKLLGENGSQACTWVES